jgi:5'-3' exonuclease
MGIKHFFAWFSQKHSACVTKVHVHDPIPQTIDTLALDLNGIFHPAAQKIFQYGEHARVKSLLNPIRRINHHSLQQKTFKEVCRHIDEIVSRVRPLKRLFLCVDGVAGASKMAQQRQRRFKSSLTREEGSNEFDSNCITPGTQFMDELTSYIDCHVRLQKRTNPLWKPLEVLFSNEKVPGEGEAKCIAYVRQRTSVEDRFCIYGLDADLVMLCLALKRPHVYIYRDDTYNTSQRFVLDIGKFSRVLRSKMGTRTAIEDFIFLCFMVGNDFLPSIPGLEILMGGIELMLDLYIQVCTKPDMGFVDLHKYTLRLPILFSYMKELTPHITHTLKNKYKVRKRYFRDEVMDRHFHEDDKGEVLVVFDRFKKDYYATKLPKADVNTVCVEYLKGLQWVIHYYMKGMPNWNWNYPYHYGPFIDDISRCKEFKGETYPYTQPCRPFQQLLAVLPRKSRGLLPKALGKLMEDNSPIHDLYPDTFKVDVDGKRAEWEGIAILPLVDLPRVKRWYRKTIDLVDSKERRRDHVGVPIVYP